MRGINSRNKVVDKIVYVGDQARKLVSLETHNPVIVLELVTEHVNGQYDYLDIDQTWKRFDCRQRGTSRRDATVIVRFYGEILEFSRV